ncbi:MAG: replication endonuclease [Lachnospiraceae bacterium]|nr:replication endonuclease [Lachnospiraceae bacterium]
MLLTDDKNYNYAYLKRLGNSYKLIRCNEVKKKGVETVNISTEIDSCFRKVGYRYDKYFSVVSSADFACDNDVFLNYKESDEETKLSNNISRARNKILEYVLCNDFNFFVTLTLDSKKYDRTNLKQFNSDFNSFIRNYNARKDANIKFLLIPETHLDGCWHMHGFIMGLPFDRLEKLELHGSRNLPIKIVEKLKSGHELFSFSAYEKKFGYNLFEPICSKKASALYMSKYLTKDISRNVTSLGNHLYYCSKGLNKAEIVKQGQFLDSEFVFDFSNDFGSQSFFDELSDNELQELKNKIGSVPISIDDYKRGYKMKNGWRQYCDTDTGEIISNEYRKVVDLFD